MRTIWFVLLFFIFLFSVGIIGARPVPGTNISPFGCQIVWPHDVNLEKFINRMNEAGIQWGRSDMFWWGLIESAKGVYRFDRSDYPGYANYNSENEIKMLRDKGIEPFSILGYGNPLYDNSQGPSTDEGRTAFGNYCYACAMHFKNEVTYWEVWNEPNTDLFWGKTPNASDYTKLVKEASKRIKEANPEAKVAGGVTAGMDLNFLNSCFQNGLLESVDIITVHPYRGTKPESVNTEFQTLRNSIKQYTAKDIKIWTGEWGYNTYAHKLSEKSQAKALARMMMNNFSQGIEVSIWFSIHAFPESSGTINDPEWGLLDYNLNPRPSFYAMQTLNKFFKHPLLWMPSNTLGITTNPALTGLRNEVIKQGNDNHFFIAVWLDSWPPNDSYSGKTMSISFILSDKSDIKCWDSLNGNSIAIQKSVSGNQYTISNLKIMDYPYYIEIIPNYSNSFLNY